MSVSDAFRQPGWLHTLAVLEGASLIGLMNIAMPLKYLADMPMVVRYWGMVHGLLFVAYVVCFGLIGLRRRWPIKALFWGGLVSIVPWGWMLTDDYLPEAP